LIRVALALGAGLAGIELAAQLAEVEGRLGAVAIRRRRRPTLFSSERIVPSWRFVGRSSVGARRCVTSRIGRALTRRHSYRSASSIAAMPAIDAERLRRPRS
jgi:hypothetical protein